MSIYSHTFFLHPLSIDFSPHSYWFLLNFSEEEASYIFFFVHKKNRSIIYCIPLHAVFFCLERYWGIIHSVAPPCYRKTAALCYFGFCYGIYSSIFPFLLFFFFFFSFFLVIVVVVTSFYTRSATIFGAALAKEETNNQEMRISFLGGKKKTR